MRKIRAARLPRTSRCSEGRRVGFTALAQRHVNMRLWRLFVAAKKESCIWVHMTVCYEVPIFSFCRYLSNCEFTTGVNFPGKRDAIDMWSSDKLRLLGGSAKWGTGYQNLSTVPGLEQGVSWRDLNPGLEPPKAVAASTEEIKQLKVGASTSDILGDGDDMLDDASLGDLLDGTTPEERSLQRLKLRVEDDRARIVIRPRDYRVLEAKPKR